MPTAENDKDTRPKLPPGRTLDSVIAEHEGLPLWMQRIFEGVKTYQNVIYAVLTVVLLSWAILKFRATQAEARVQEAWWELEQAKSPEALRALAEKYDDLPIAPFIRLQLGRALMDGQRYEEAMTELQLAKTRWPESMPGKLAGTLLNSVGEIKGWGGKDGLLEQKLAELRKEKVRDEGPPRDTHSPNINDAGLPEVEIATPGGKVTIELDEETAPNAVAAFVRNVERGLYGKSYVWKVEPEAVFLGDSLPDGTGPVGATIAWESSALGNSGAKSGLVALVRTLPAEGQEDTEALRNSAAFRFVIFTADAPLYDGKFLVVGRVKDGLDAVRKLQQKETIFSARMLQKRSHPYEPKEIPKAPEPPR